MTQGMFNQCTTELEISSPWYVTIQVLCVKIKYCSFTFWDKNTIAVLTALEIWVDFPDQIPTNISLGLSQAWIQTSVKGLADKPWGTEHIQSFGVMVHLLCRMAMSSEIYNDMEILKINLFSLIFLPPLSSFPFETQTFCNGLFIPQSLNFSIFQIRSYLSIPLHQETWPHTQQIPQTHPAPWLLVQGKCMAKSYYFAAFSSNPGTASPQILSSVVILPA